MFTFTRIAVLVGLSLAAVSVVHGAEVGSDGTQVVGVETTRTTDKSGAVIEKRVVKKIRARTVVDFEEASIEGKVKKPNAAYLLHGADLDFKHLYRIKNNQRGRIISAYEYLR